MSKFNTSTEKLRAIWGIVEKNINEIKDKNNIDKFEFFIDLLNQQNIKVPIQIFDSGNINKTPFLISTASTGIKSEKMPTLVSYSQNIDINLPEFLLPFVKYSIEVKPVPNTEVHGIFEYDPSTWSGDNMEVRGDGILIWKGATVVDTNLPLTFITHDESDLIEKGISLDLTKETWDADIDVDPPIGGNDPIQGKVLYISGTEIINENSCLTNDDTNEFITRHYRNKDHKIIELTSTGFKAIGDETIKTYTPDGGGGCNLNTVVNTNVTRTIAFIDLDNYVFIIDTPIGEVTVSKNLIESQIFTKGGRWLFYSTELQNIFQSKNIGSDGDFAEIELSNLPDTNDGDILPYTNITLKRNLDGTNDPPILKRQSEGAFGGILSNTLTSIAKTGREFKNYLKTSPSTTNNDTYRFNLSGGFLIIAPSIEKLFVTRFKSDIITQEFTSLGSNDWNAEIDKDESTFISGTVNNIFHRKERVSGSVITEFFTDPANNSKHGITNLTSTTFTAIGDETVTVIPFDPELPPVITKRSNIIVTKDFSDSVTYSIGINNSVDFPIYNDIYTIVGTTYDLTTEDHTFLPKNIWVPETQDVIINIKANLVNSLYWREERKYKNDF